MIQFVQTNIKEILFGFSGIAAVVIVFLIIKMFLFSSPFRSKKLSKYNEILYLKNRNEADKVSFAIRDYLGFDIPEEEIDFAFSNPRNAFMFLTHRKKAGKSKVKFGNGKYTVINNNCTKCCIFSSWLFFIIGVAMFSVYISFSPTLFYSIEDKKLFILLSIYVLYISLSMMILSYVCISENQSAEQLEELTSANDEGEKNETGKETK